MCAGYFRQDAHNSDRLTPVAKYARSSLIWGWMTGLEHGPNLNFIYKYL